MDEATRADFAAFAGARWSALVRSGVLLGCTLHEAEDLAQATLLRALLKWKHVRGALAVLTQEQREVVVLRIHLQLSEAETAQALGIPRGTAKSRFSRALARLAEDPGILELHRGGER